MSSIIIRCSFCSKKNRIPSDRVGQRAKCGSCGQIISEAGTNTCKLCNLHVSDGINLSNGEMIHESCLESIQEKEEDIKNDIHVKQEELNKLQSEIERREGVGFKIISMFSKPDVDTDDIEKAKEELGKISKDDGKFFSIAERVLKIIEDVTNKRIESKAASHYFKGLIYSIKDRWDEAIDEYNKAIELNQKFFHAYRRRGYVHGRKGQFDKAISDFNKAIELNPRYAKAHGNRGLAYFNKGQIDQAISDFNKAIEINPRYAEAHNNRGLTYGKKGHIDKAISDFSKAIEINPKYAKAYYKRGIAYKEKGEYDKARNDDNKAQSLGYKRYP